MESSAKAEYECEICDYWNMIHGVDGYDYRNIPEKCKRCLKPFRERLTQGIYKKEG